MDHARHLDAHPGPVEGMGRLSGPMETESVAVTLVGGWVSNSAGTATQFTVMAWLPHARAAALAKARWPSVTAAHGPNPAAPTSDSVGTSTTVVPPRAQRTEGALKADEGPMQRELDARRPRIGLEIGERSRQRGLDSHRRHHDTIERSQRAATASSAAANSWRPSKAATSILPTAAPDSSRPAASSAPAHVSAPTTATARPADPGARRGPILVSHRGLRRRRPNANAGPRARRATRCRDREGPRPRALPGPGERRRGRLPTSGDRPS